MAKRARPALNHSEQNYFVGDRKNIQFIPTGCTLLDCALGGGYPLGRVVNIVGDRSSAKTALATEALTNFVRAYPDGEGAYRDAEAAFDKGYAAAMGLPIAKINFGNEEAPLTTVEAFARDFDKFLESHSTSGTPGMYVLDSLDSLSDEAEMEADIGKGTYGTGKAKTLSTFFRKYTRKIEQSNVLLLIVSQVRENIGVMFGEKYRRAGGKALDFYASLIFWLAHVKTLKKTVNKVERPYGVTIKANVKKNKIALPFRQVEFDFIFGFGVEDLGASLEWLKEVGRLEGVGRTDFREYLRSLDDMTNEEYAEEQKRIAPLVRQVWAEIETSFLPKRQKYTNA